jgi:hypothetical protein|tara:strand:- start:5316 stop:5657 length:342 start_codon:yes stop_codon:yes gene_type:complete
MLTQFWNGERQRMEQVFLDPGTIGPESWSELGSLLRSLWLTVLFVVLFASNMLVGHNMLPSLIESGHVPKSWQKVRPVLYAGAIISIGLASFFVSRAIEFAGVLRNFWPDYWI